MTLDILIHYDLVVVLGLPSSASWQDLKVGFSNFFCIKVPCMWIRKTYN